MKQIINYLKETINKEKHLIKFLVILFIVGVIVGSLLINFLSKEDQSLIIKQLSTFIFNCKRLTSDVFGINAFTSNLTSNLFQVFTIFILGLSVIGIPAVIFIIFYKGFMLGATLGTFILKFNLRGSIGVILYAIPSQIFMMLIYVFISFFACYVSLKFIKAFIKKDNLNFKYFIGKYLLSFIITIILIILLSLFDSYILPLLIKLFSYII